MARPYIYGAKHIALGVGTLVASFALYAIAAAITGDGPPLLLWGIGTVIMYRIGRHYLSATHEAEKKERARKQNSTQPRN